jgi:hypothetical protein
MIERLGVDTDWAQKSKVAYAKLVKLLEPKIAGAAADPAEPVPTQDKAPVAPPPPPTPPPRRGEAPDRAPPTGPDALGRQIL